MRMRLYEVQASSKVPPDPHALRGLRSHEDRLKGSHHVEGIAHETSHTAAGNSALSELQEASSDERQGPLQLVRKPSVARSSTSSEGIGKARAARAARGKPMILITTLPVWFMIIGLILMKWEKMKDWRDVGYVMFAAGSFALCFALSNKTIALLK
jgi:hypothetical protein